MSGNAQPKRLSTSPIAVPEELAVEEHETPSIAGEDEHNGRHDSIETRSEHSYDEEAAESIPEADLQRTATSQSKPIPVVKIPRRERFGLLSTLTILYEAEEPKNYPRNIKWFITLWIALASVTAPMGTSIVFREYSIKSCMLSCTNTDILPTIACLGDIGRAFGTSPFITNLSAAFYLLSMAICPLWWSSFSETAGRRNIYIISFTIYVVVNIVGAFSSSIGMFIAFRVLSGGTSASVQAVGAGTVADIWEPRERGRGMSIFYIGPLCGPLFAPIIGGALNTWLGWRSIQWFQVCRCPACFQLSERGG